jgi:hypothetical protein
MVVIRDTIQKNITGGNRYKGIMLWVLDNLKKLNSTNFSTLKENIMKKQTRMQKRDPTQLEVKWKLMGS